MVKPKAASLLLDFQLLLPTGSPACDVVDQLTSIMASAISKRMIGASNNASVASSALWLPAGSPACDVVDQLTSIMASAIHKRMIRAWHHPLCDDGEAICQKMPASRSLHTKVQSCLEKELQ